MSSKDIRHAISNVKRGKSPGHDCLSVEHLKYAIPRMDRLLSMFYALCVRLIPTVEVDKNRGSVISLKRHRRSKRHSTDSGTIGIW